MNKSKTIILFTIGNIDHPSSRIRGIQYIPYFEKAGYKVKWIPRIPPKPKNKFEKWISFPLGKRWLGVRRLWSALFAKADFFFIQKIFISPFLLKILKIRKIPFIFDFDDAIYLHNDKSLKKTLRLIKTAAKVIVSSPVLEKFCINHGVKANLITTPVDTERIKPAKKTISEDKAFVIGWIGSFWTTKYLNLVSEPLQKLAKRHNIILRLVGADKSFVIPQVEIEHLDWAFDKENQYLQSFDVGIMPLNSDKYSEAKGGYKLLMYMAAGIPSVASPVGINNDIVVRGQTGFLAESNGQWETALRFLIENHKKRIIFGENSRKLAEKLYSRDVCFGKLLQLMKNK